MIKSLLWDIDGTLLDFKAAEKAALRACFSVFHLGECSDEMIARYSEINQNYWRRLEAGKLSKAEILYKRFEDFFATENIKCDEISAFNREYQVRLSDTIVFIDNAYDLVKSLKGYVKQYAVTNGTYLAQSRKLEKSGLNQLLDGIFISEKVGYEKPNIHFFDFVFSQIEFCDRDQIMIVGDSLTSDMRGGNNAGIKCCWYNPNREEVGSGITIDYSIQNLNQVKGLLA